MFAKNIVNFIGCDSDYKSAQAVLFGAGFDGTTSNRPGTRFAPSAMRAESFGIETYSPYLDKDLTDIKVFDCGNLELPFGNTKAVIKMIYDRVKTILKDDKLPCMIGGEHLVTLGVVKALCKKYEDLYIIHFDAHSDMREEYLGEKLSHACVMRRCYELVGENRIFQYGIRSGDREEFRFANGKVFTQKFNLKGIENLAYGLNGKKVYITLDLDVLDPSIFSGTGTPEAGGVSYSQLMEALTSIKDLDVVGFDINELSPHYDPSGVSTATACKILREMLLLFIK